MKIYFYKYGFYLDDNLNFTDEENYAGEFDLNKDGILINSKNGKEICVDDSFILKYKTYGQCSFKIYKNKYLLTYINDKKYAITMTKSRAVLANFDLEDDQKIEFLYNDIIGKYKLEKVLGEGAFGTTYKGIDTENNETVAIKKIKIKDYDAEEVDNLKKLSNQCNKYFVCYKDSFRIDDDAYIVMEYLEGYEELSRVFENIRNDQELFITITKNLCKGINLLHRLGFAHNDIKPANVMVNVETGNIKYIDYGMTCYNRGCKRMKGGTPAFMEPSLYLNKGPTTLEQLQQGDLWSLGIIIYEILTGKIPSEIYKNNYYLNEYDYKDDKNKEKIENYLKSINVCFSLSKLITRGHKECNC